MMYNRYIPDSNGVYKRHSILIPDELPKEDHCENSYAQEKQTCDHKQNQSCVGGFDLGDLLLICVVILILSESEDDFFPILLAVAAFLLIQ